MDLHRVRLWNPVPTRVGRANQVGDDRQFSNAADTSWWMNRRGRDGDGLNRDP